MDSSYAIAPGKHFWAGELLPDTYDIMGATPAMWPNKRSYEFLQQYFATFVAAADAAAATLPVTPAGRTIFFSGNMEFFNGGFYEMDRASVSLFDLTGTGLTPDSTPDLRGMTASASHRVEAYRRPRAAAFRTAVSPQRYPSGLLSQPRHSCRRHHHALLWGRPA